MAGSAADRPAATFSRFDRDTTATLEGTAMRTLIASLALGLLAAAAAGADPDAGLAAVPRAWRIGHRRRAKTSHRVRTRQEREVEDFGPERLLVADRRRRSSCLHGVRRRQTLHDRLQPRRRERSLAGRSAGQSRSSLSTLPKAVPPLRRPSRTARGSSPTLDRAGCSVTTCRGKNFGGTSCRPRPRRSISARAFRPSWPMAWSFWCGTKTRTPKSSRSTRRRASSAGRKIASRNRRSAPRSSATRPMARRSWRRDGAR